MYLDGIWLKRSWGGVVKNVAVLVAIGVDQVGYRQILGVVEGANEDEESWRQFLRHLKGKRPRNDTSELGCYFATGVQRDQSRRASG